MLTNRPLRSSESSKRAGSKERFIRESDWHQYLRKQLHRWWWCVSVLCIQLSLARVCVCVSECVFVFYRWSRAVWRTEPLSPERDSISSNSSNSLKLSYDSSAGWVTCVTFNSLWSIIDGGKYGRKSLSHSWVCGTLITALIMFKLIHFLFIFLFKFLIVGYCPGRG